MFAQDLHGSTWQNIWDLLGYQQDNCVCLTLQKNLLSWKAQFLSEIEIACSAEYSKHRALMVNYLSSIMILQATVYISQQRWRISIKYCWNKIFWLAFKWLSDVVVDGVEVATGVGAGAAGVGTPSSLSSPWWACTRPGVLAQCGRLGLNLNTSSLDISTNVVDSHSVCILKSDNHFLLKSAKKQVQVALKPLWK